MKLDSHMFLTGFGKFLFRLNNLPSRSCAAPKGAHHAPDPSSKYKCEYYGCPPYCPHRQCRDVPVALCASEKTGCNYNKEQHECGYLKHRLEPRGSENFFNPRNIEQIELLSCLQCQRFPSVTVSICPKVRLQR